MPSINVRGDYSLVIIVLALNLHNSYQAPQNDLSATERGEKCFTPSNDVGTCVPMEDCQSLLDLQQKSKFQPRAAYYVERSSCQTNQTKNLKCCPNKELKNKHMTDQFPVSNRSSVSFPENPRDKNENFASTTDFPQITTSAQSTTSRKIDERMKLLPTDCGKRDVAPLIRRVTGGEPAILGEYPWIVALGFRSEYIEDAVPAWNCGGSLITPKHVLTAAHCAHNRENMIMQVIYQVANW